MRIRDKLDCGCRRLALRLLLCALFLGAPGLRAAAGQEPPPENGAEAPGGEGTQVAERVEVQPVASDRAIDKRLTRILEATGWFADIDVQVEEDHVGQVIAGQFRTQRAEFGHGFHDKFAAISQNFSDTLPQEAVVFD
jgi:hypothetical protein